MKTPSTLFDLADIRYGKLDKGEARVLPWVAAHGDDTRSLDYDLTKDSVVFEVGGYYGVWTGQMSERYKCSYVVFEPVESFVTILNDKFGKDPKVTIYPVGLSGKTRTVKINVDLEASSIFKDDAGSETIKLVKAHDYIKQFAQIDVMQINIEGGEYELIEHMIATGDIKKVVNLKVQFHDFVPKARQQRSRIQKQLAETHELTWCYPFIWENWRRKP